ncbi:MAG: PadR family transcriptional regulator [Thermoanaerobaculia bacterium]|nr:PadR family transcriptional regulator [Thermoanaerobaculia bacterium]
MPKNTSPTSPQSAEAGAQPPQEVLRGTLDLLILRVLDTGPRHGWAITQRIQQTSKGVLEINQGSLYPALQRLERRGWIRGEWRRTEQNRRARFYLLTPDGERAFGDEQISWRRYVQAIEAVLTT